MVDVRGLEFRVPPTLNPKPCHVVRQSGKQVHRGPGEVPWERVEEWEERAGDEKWQWGNWKERAGREGREEREERGEGEERGECVSGRKDACMQGTGMTKLAASRSMPAWLLACAMQGASTNTEGGYNASSTLLACTHACMSLTPQSPSSCPPPKKNKKPARPYPTEGGRCTNGVGVRG